MQSPWWKSFKAALCFTLVGAACGAFVLFFFGVPNPAQGWAWLPLYAGAAAFLTTLAIWWAYVARPKKPGMLRGAVAGLVSGVVAHPVMWYLMICGIWLQGALPTRPRGAVEDDALNPITGVFGAFAFSLWSVILTGWLTAPAGALVGALLGWWQARTATGATAGSVAAPQTSGGQASRPSLGGPDGG